MVGHIHYFGEVLQTVSGPPSAAISGPSLVTAGGVTAMAWLVKTSDDCGTGVAVTQGAWEVGPLNSQVFRFTAPARPQLNSDRQTDLAGHPTEPDRSTTLISSPVASVGTDLRSWPTSTISSRLGRSSTPSASLRPKSSGRHQTPATSLSITRDESSKAWWLRDGTRRSRLRQARSASRKAWCVAARRGAGAFRPPAALRSES